MNPDTIRAEIRRAVKKSPEPFDGHTLLPLLHRHFTFRQVQNHLHQLAQKGELVSQYVKRGRRADAVVFTTSSSFGDRSDRRKMISQSLNRLDQVVKGWFCAQR